MGDSEKNITYSIVIPVFNSEQTLEELIWRLSDTMNAITEKYEVVLIDDCSQDNSWKKLKELRRRDKKLKIIHLQKNFGQYNATLCGFSHAKGDYIITMDDDLQNPPEEIPLLVKKIQEGFSVVYGKYIVKRHSCVENFFSNILQWFIHFILDIPRMIFISSFAIFTSDVVKNVVAIKSSYIYLPAFVRKSVPTHKITNVEVLHDLRKYGKSNYSVRKYISQTFNLLFNYSALPLVFIGIIGVVVSLLSFSYGIYIIYRYLTDHTYGLIGWNSIMVTLTFLGGLILFSIAIMGEYLLRILTEVSYGQQYLIEEMEL